MSFAELIPLSFVEIIGDFALKGFANGGQVHLLFLGVLSYGGVIFFLIKALKGSTVLLVNGGWDGISSLVESAAAFVFLGERFDSACQYFGVLLICVGLYFLKIPWKK
jgi:multidrug transporter EmrE-like cation transporter